MQFATSHTGDKTDRCKKVLYSNETNGALTPVHPNRAKALRAVCLCSASAIEPPQSVTQFRNLGRLEEVGQSSARLLTHSTTTAVTYYTYLFPLNMTVAKEIPVAINKVGVLFYSHLLNEL